MSLVGVHPGEFRSRERNFSGCNMSRKSERSCSEESLQMAREMSFEELNNYFNQQDAVLTIEDLRHHLNSCFTCGVSWNEDHVSLDCRECGGYSLERPCPECDGKCTAVWKRDLSTSHSLRRAQWEGQCTLPSSMSSASQSPASSSTSPDTKLQLLQAIVQSPEDSLCVKMKTLSTS